MLLLRFESRGLSGMVERALLSERVKSRRGGGAVPPLAVPPEGRRF